MSWTLARRSFALSLSLTACQGARIQDDGPSEDLSGVNDREGQVCEVFGEPRGCGQHDAGVQYCGVVADDGTDITWGVCLSEIECEPGETNECDNGAVRTCELDDGEPAWGACDEDEWNDGESTPLVVVFPGEALEYRPAGTATFSIDGGCTTHDWPTAATPWLAMDRDRSGSIDAGHELFGSGTRLASGARAEHGFAALAELDANGDGFVSAADPRFGELLLWSDHDGDRRSTHWEHESLAARGVVAIPIDFTRERTCDDRGNCAIERALVELQVGDATLVADVVDVHLACQ
jgi:hypothetical protein